MKSRAAPRFWKAYDELPPEIRGAARKAYRLFRQNPRHPSLQFKKIHASEPVYSVRVTGGYRAVGLLENDQVTWIWIEATPSTTACCTACSFVSPKHSR